MDEQRSEAVNETFVKLHNKGLISRDSIPVNWDCTICDKDGREMLESNGNVIHGMSLEEAKTKGCHEGFIECGTDALRFHLIRSISEAINFNMDIKRVVNCRRWCGKLWYGFQTAIDILGEDYIPPVTIDVSPMPPICQWALSALNKAVDKIVKYLEAYKLSAAADVLYCWWQNTLYNTFLEAIKFSFLEDSELYKQAEAACRYTLWVCLETSLRLLHPFMPFVTEELWQRLPHDKSSSWEASIMISRYPSVIKDWDNDGLENEMAVVLKIVEMIKSLKPKQDQNERRQAFALCRDREFTATIARHRHIILVLSKVSHFKVLSGFDEIPDGCVSAVVNADCSVHLEVKGAFNIVTEVEKLSKKRDEILKLQLTLTQRMNASGYQENATENIKKEDMRLVNSLSKKLDSINGYEMKLKSPGVDDLIGPSLSLNISSICKEELWSDMTQPGFAAPLTPDKGSLIEKRFLAFLTGFRMNGYMYYIEMCIASRSMLSEEIHINYKDLQLFDTSLANTISIFFDSVQKHLVNATKKFLENEVKSPCENLAFKICDLPRRRFISLKIFWDSPGNHPSVAADIYCGTKSLGITKSTPPGRIVFCNLLRKLFGSFEKGNSYNGKWNIEQVMVDLDTYQVEIIAPFCGKCNHWTIHNDLKRCATDIIPEFRCYGHLPAFFNHLQGTLNEFMPEHLLNASTWNKFHDFVNAHLALKAPLVRSTFWDDLHQIYWTLGKESRKILVEIINSKFHYAKWKDFLMKEMPNPILEVVFMHNKKKKEIIRRKSGDTPVQIATTDVAEDSQLAQGPDLQGVQVTVGDSDPAYHPDAESLQNNEREIFEDSAEGLLKLTRHLKQHGTAGSRDKKGEQTLERLSDLDIVISQYLDMLIELLRALIYNIDDFEGSDCSCPHYKKFMVMFEEIFNKYNAPEALPHDNRQEKYETFVFLEHNEDFCIDPDCASTGDGAKVESPGSSDTSTAKDQKVLQGGEHATA